MEISIFEIIIFGIGVNFFVFILFVLAMLVSIITSVKKGNFELMVWLEKFKERSQPVLDHKKTLGFFVRNETLILKLMPFASLLQYPIFTYGIIKHGFVEFMELELAREKAKYGLE